MNGIKAVTHALTVNDESGCGILVDALPYLDKDYGEADRQMALQLIDDECRLFRPTKNYLQHMPAPDLDMFLTPSLLKEQARMTKKLVMIARSMLSSWASRNSYLALKFSVTACFQ